MSSFTDVHLSTERLDLRPLGAADARALFAIFSDTEVMRYWSSTPWKSLAVSERFIEHDQAAMADGRHVRLAVVRRTTNDLIGTCTLFDHVEQCRRAEVGFGLSPSVWGQGYATEAVHRLISYGFERLSLNRVEADIDPRNTSSARCLERLGFTKEGHLRQRWIVGDEVSDSALYGLLRAKWEANAGLAGGDADLGQRATQR